MNPSLKYSKERSCKEPFKKNINDLSLQARTQHSSVRKQSDVPPSISIDGCLMDLGSNSYQQAPVFRPLKTLKTFTSNPNMLQLGSPKSSMFSPFNLGGDDISTPAFGIDPSFSMQLNSCLKPQSQEDLDFESSNDEDLLLGSDFEVPSL